MVLVVDSVVVTEEVDVVDSWDGEAEEVDQ